MIKIEHWLLINNHIQFWSKMTHPCEEYGLYITAGIDEVWVRSEFIIGLTKSVGSKIYIFGHFHFSLVFLIALHKPLAEFLSTALGKIGEVHLNLLASWHRLVSSAQSTNSRWGSSQDFNSRPILFPLWICAWDHFPFARCNFTQDWIFWPMISGFPEEFGDNPLCSLVSLLSLEQQIHWQQNTA